MRFPTPFVAAAWLALAATAQATSITRAQFRPDAIAYDFETATFEASSATDGWLTVTQGMVSNIPTPVSNILSTPSLLRGLHFSRPNPGPGLLPADPIRLSWSTPVAAVGFQILVELGSDVSLELLDASNGSLALLTRSSGSLTNEGWSLTGFLGIDWGVGQVSSALIHSTAPTLIVDSIVYQPVPEPGTWALFATGLAAVRRRLGRTALA